MMRTIKIPVAEIVDGGTKSEFYADLRTTLDLSRRSANLVMSECVRIDTGLMVGGKAPSPKGAPPKSLYHSINTHFPGACAVAATISRDVWRKYHDARWEISIGKRSVPQFRSWPWPLLKTSKFVVNAEAATVRLKLLRANPTDDSRFREYVVRLSTNGGHQRQLNGLRRAEAIRDSKIFIDRKHKAIVDIACRFPAVTERAKGGTLTVSTMRDNLFVASRPSDKVPFVITGQIAHKWQLERKRRQQQLRQDSKSGKRRALRKQKALAADKYRRRISTFIHESTMQIVKHAQRRGVASVQLDMTVKSFMPSFPYFEFGEKLAYKCADAGLQFTNATQVVVNPDVEKPHVYFKYSPATHRVKIGQTGRKKGERHASATDSADRDLVILAVDNQPKTKLRKRETHFHAQFAAHRVCDGLTLSAGEWFDAEPILYWLREVQWLGNAGNVSQLKQVLDPKWFKDEHPPQG